MIFKLRIGHIRITFTIAPVVDVIGVNSKLRDGNHIVMWDFDDLPLTQVVHNLRLAQYKYWLPKIYVLESSPGNHYIAYCFKRLPWRKVVEIIASTQGVDWNFFKYGVYREHFTLRTSPKGDYKPKLVTILESPIEQDASPKDLLSWTIYETLPPFYEGRRVAIGEK